MTTKEMIIKGKERSIKTTRNRIKIQQEKLSQLEDERKQRVKTLHKLWEDLKIMEENLHEYKK